MTMPHALTSFPQLARLRHATTKLPSELHTSKLAFWARANVASFLKKVPPVYVFFSSTVDIGDNMCFMLMPNLQSPRNPAEARGQRLVRSEKWV